MRRPILLKIAPDLTWTQIDDVIELAKEIHLDGLVATNTTISRNDILIDDDPVIRNAKLEKIGAGGLSGMPLKNRSTEVIQYIHHKAGELPLIATGGVFNDTDAKEKFSAGSTLVEVWTGFIYEGPGLIRDINKRLLERQ